MIGKLFRLRKSIRRRPCTKARLALEQLECRLVPSVSVLSWRNDALLTGQDLSETTLTPSNVNTNSFGKKFATNVDGNVFAQPLTMPGVMIAGQGTHDVVFVATEHDSIYAVDANSGAILWQKSLLNPLHGGTVSTVPTSVLNNGNLGVEEGITSTGVIDAATGTWYVLAETKEVVGTDNHYSQQLHAIDIQTGNEKLGGPKLVADTIFNGGGYTYVSGPTVNGTGDGSVGGQLTYNALRQSQRAALALINGIVYVPSASQGDNGPYHGWIVGYGAADLSLKAAFVDTPNGSEGGIWEGGGGLAWDGTFMYLETGNGSFNTNAGNFDANGFPKDHNLGNLFLKLKPDSAGSQSNQNGNGWGLDVVDYFAPFNTNSLNGGDQDIGSEAPLLVPGTNLIVGAGKEGRIYLIDKTNMGKFDPNTDHVLEELTGNPGSFATPAYFNGAFYYATQGTHGKRFVISGNMFNMTPASTTPDGFGFTGSSPEISANVTSNGILWAVDRNAAQLRAYDAANLANELWTSGQAANNRDQLGGISKFIVPTVADGRVFVGTNNQIVMYSLLATSVPAAPTNVQATAGDMQVALSWTAPIGAVSYDIYRSINGGAQARIQSGITSTSFTDSGLTNGSTYSYQVSAVNSQGEGPKSTPAVSATPQPQAPAAPTNLLAHPGEMQITLTWTASSGATSYNIFRGTTTGGEGSTAIMTGVTATTFTDTGLTNGTTYFYEVTAVNGGGESPRSNEASTTAGLVAPLAPTNLSVVANTGSQTTLTWTDNADNETGFHIDRATDRAFSMNLTTLNAPAHPGTGTVNFIDTALNPGITYFYRVRATNGAGDSANSNFASVTTPVPPNIPSNVVATAITTTEVDLTFQDNATNEDGFKVTRKTGTGGDFIQIATLPANPGTGTVSFKNTGLTPGTFYDYHIVAFNAAGPSEAAGISLDTVPSPPAGLTAKPGAGEVALSWTAPVAPAALTYDVYRGTTSGGEGTTPIASGVAGTTFTDSAVAGNTTYFYQVTAVDPASASPVNTTGQSAPSNEASATPTAVTPIHIHFTAQTGGDTVANYLSDVGLAYGSRGNGLTFGWNKDNTTNGRDRDAANSPDQLHDGLAHLQKPNNPNAWWGIAVPNGTYSVHLIAGDPSNIDSVYKINVGGTLSGGTVSGGVLAISGRPTAATHWFENTVTVTVTGGVLYVSNAAGSSNNKIDAIDVRQVPAGAHVATAPRAVATAPLATVNADPTPEPGPPPGTKPPVSPGNGLVPGVPLPGGGSLYYAKDAKLDGFAWFARLHGWFPEVLHSRNAVSPGHRVVDMAYADHGTMTFKNVVAAAAGTYKVTFRYAFASGLFPGVKDREMGLSVNGGVVVNPMHFPITGSFETYRDASVLVHLQQGPNVITLFNISEHGVSRVDTMKVTPAAP